MDMDFARLNELVTAIPYGKAVNSALYVYRLPDMDLGEELNTLMSRYWDRPMDFADATLVYLARRESLSTILTVDRADFETYRIEGKRKFRVLPTGRL